MLNSSHPTLELFPKIEALYHRLILFPNALITDILGFPWDKWTQETPSPQVLKFCYSIALRTVNSLIQKRYSDFDGQTTSNCCHGLATLALSLIRSVRNHDLRVIQVELNEAINELDSSASRCSRLMRNFPKPIIELSKLYILFFIKDECPRRLGVTVPKKLCEIVPFSKNFTQKVVKNLQKHFSNGVAYGYGTWAEQASEVEINGVAAGVWGRYVGDEFLRTDYRGTMYAPCLFSMQVTLAHLSSERALVAVVSDLKDDEGVMKGRFAQLLRGDGEGGFVRVEDAESSEPVVVFGGCTHGSMFERMVAKRCLAGWMDDLPRLVLANDVFYPQYPDVRADTEFDSSPIIPDEAILRDVVAECSAISGVTAEDPSLFCLTHIYPASVGEVLEGDLPPSMIPSAATSCMNPSAVST